MLQRESQLVIEGPGAGGFRDPVTEHDSQAAVVRSFTQGLLQRGLLQQVMPVTVVGDCRW